jgi:hypothetical protein
MPYALLAHALSHSRHVASVNAWGVGTGVVGEHGCGASAVGAAAGTVMKVAMCCKSGAVVVVVGTELGQARCDLIARSLVLQVAC